MTKKWNLVFFIFTYQTSSQIYLEQRKEIQQNSTELENFDIYFGWILTGIAIFIIYRLSKVNFSSKPNMQYSAYTKPSTLELFNFVALNFHQKLEKDIEPIINVKIFKFRENW